MLPRQGAGHGPKAHICQSLCRWAAQAALRASMLLLLAAALSGGFEEMVEVGLKLAPVQASGGWKEQSWIMAM